MTDTPTPTPRDAPCTHPIRDRLSGDGDIVQQRCALCDQYLRYDLATGQTTTEVTGR